jgi:hypothetical protein
MSMDKQEGDSISGNPQVENGSDVVMNLLENILAVLGKMKNYLASSEEKYKTNPAAASTLEVLRYFEDMTLLIQDLVFSTMDAFQFQNSNRQKLMKVMSTLSKLSECLNDLLGGEMQAKPAGQGGESPAQAHDIKLDAVASEVQELQKNN